LDLLILAFLVASFIVILGFLGEEFSRKTGIPDVVFLLLLGLLLGPVFQIFERETLMSITPYFAALALIIILFDGGINMELSKVVRRSPRTSALAVSNFLLSVIVTALLCKFLFGWRYLNGLLLGAIIGGTSSIVVIPIARRTEASEETVTVLSLESILTDVLCTVATFVMIDIFLSGEISLGSALTSVATEFSVGAFVGFLLGLGWSVVLEAIRGKSNAYMLTLAMLLLAYVSAENFGGSGAISALFLGLVLGNAPYVMKILRLKTQISLDKDIKTFHGEISFLIRSFFFVFTGLLFSLSLLNLILFGVALSFVFLAIRAVAVGIAAFKSKELKEKTLMAVMLPRGLAAAVLASLPMTYGIFGSESFPEIVFSVILTTVVICTVGVALSKGQRRS